MVVALHALILVALLGLRYRQVAGRLSPDCRYYLSMAGGAKAPAPYCYRVLVPRLCFKYQQITMRVLAVVGTVACVAGVYALALSLGGSAWAALAAAMIFAMMDTAVGTWIIFPWLVDPVAMAFAVWAAVAAPIVAAVLLLLAAMTKEAAWALGSCFIVASSPALWWVPLPGLAMLLLLRLIVRPSPPDADWLKQPFRYSQMAKRGKMLDYQKSLAGLKGAPFVCAWLLPASPVAVPVVLVAVVAWLQTQVAVDHGRLIAAAIPFALAASVPFASPSLLATWVLVTLFWPFATEFL